MLPVLILFATNRYENKISNLFTIDERISKTSVFCQGIVGPMMPNYLLYALCRFIASWGVSGYIVVCYVYLAESMDNRGRAYLGVVAMMAWSCGGSAIAFFGKFLRHFLVFDWVSAISFAAIGFIISRKFLISLREVSKRITT